MLLSSFRAFLLGHGWEAKAQNGGALAHFIPRIPPPGSRPAQAAASAALAKTPAGRLAAMERAGPGHRSKAGIFGRHRPGAMSVRLAQLKGRSLWIFAPAVESPVRRYLYNIIDDKRFETATMAMILVSSLSMAVESPKTMTMPAVVTTLYAIDVASTTFFTAELVMKARARAITAES